MYVNLSFVVEISKRLKTTAGRCDWVGKDKKIFQIRLAYNNYVEFGAESMIKTLRHEMAHLIECYLYGKSGHGERFKRICVDLGGHMNSKIAGRKYSDSATFDYCKGKRLPYKYEYTCECGIVFHRKRKISEIRSRQLRCNTCRTRVADMTLKTI